MLITCNDLHLTDVPPASRVDNYVDEVFGLLDQIQQLALKVKADAVCIAGDIFHHKERPMGMPLLFRLYEWCDTLVQAGIAVLAVPGNHDLRYNKLSTLDDQPLGLMFRVGAMRNVSAYPAVFGNNTVVWGAPFPNAMSLDGWKAARAALPALCPSAKNADLRLVMLGHCFASKTGGSYFTESVLRYEDILAACPAEVFVLGHDHTNGGVTPIKGETGGAQFINLGAICRGTIGLDDLHRDITIGLVTIREAVDSAITVRQVRLKAQPVADLFNLTAKAQKDEERAKLEAYVETLQDTLASLDSTTPIEVQLGQLQLADDVRQRMEAYITSVEQA